MAATERLARMKNTLEHLRRETSSTASAAQRILNRGLTRLAEHELRAIQDFYDGALDALRASRGPSVKDIAQQQVALLQQAVHRVSVNARESLAIVAATRMELVDLMKKSGKKGGMAAKPSRLARLKASAKKAVAKVKAKAKKAQATAKKSVTKAKSNAKKSVAKARKSVNKATKKARSQAKKPVAKAKAAVKKASAKAPVARARAAAKQAQARVRSTASAARQRVAEAAAPVVSAVTAITPSPLSRAFLATSQGRKEATVHPPESKPDPSPSEPAAATTEESPSTPPPGTSGN